MVRSPLLRLTTAAALVALAGAGVHAHEATQWEPGSAGSSEATAGPVLATPLHVGEATQWIDSKAGAVARGAVLAELRQAHRKGLINDTGEGGATDRVLAQREAFNQQEHDRIVAERAAAAQAERVAALEQERLHQQQAAEGDPLLALLLIDETDPNGPAVHAYAANDVSQWRASPSEAPYSQPLRRK